jgi:hypothetical protein
MVEVGTFQVNEIRSWLGFRLDEVARWRETKAAEYPDDERNEHSAIALHSASQYVRTVDPSRSHGLVRVARIVEAAHQSGIDLLQPHFASAPLPGVESQRVASRFGFDNHPGTPDAMDHEEFLSELARAMIRDLQERLFELEKDSPLAKLLKAEGSPAAAADPAVALLDELGNVIRETQATYERNRRHDQLAAISGLVVKVRDVALVEADPNGLLQGLGPQTFPQTRMELKIAVSSYIAENGRELPASTELATGSTMTSAMKVVGGATDALEELVREVTSRL